MSDPIDRRVFTLGLAALAAAPAGAAAAADPIIAALQAGGHVVAFRHGATTRSGIDRIEWPRERQRLLSARGEEESRIIGAAFAQHGLPVGEVLASPFARCRDMAEIAFGRVDERRELLGLLSDSAGRDDRVAFMKRMLRTPPADGKNRVIVTHTSNIRAATGLTVAEGEGVVVRPTGDGFELFGRKHPDDWA